MNSQSYKHHEALRQLSSILDPGTAMSDYKARYKAFKIVQEALGLETKFDMDGFPLDEDEDDEDDVILHR